jgi:hypothetical protein
MRREVLDNRVLGANYGLYLSSTTKYGGNIVSDAGAADYTGGIDVGNNN